MTKARSRPKTKSNKRHPDQPRPFSGIRDVVFNAFAKIGSPIDKTDILDIKKGSSGIRVEVIKTISFLTNKQMLKLIGSIRFKTVQLSRFRIGAIQYKGKPSLKFLFYVQGARAATTASINSDVLDTDIQAALKFMADHAAVQAPAPLPHRVSAFFDLVAEFNANHGFRVVHEVAHPSTIRPLHVAAAVNVKALEARYRLSPFTFRFSNRDGSLDVTRSIKAYTREHALDLLKKSKSIPKGFRVSSASGKAQLKTESAIRLYIDKANADDAKSVKAMFVAYKDERAPGYPKCRILSGSQSGKLLLAFGRPLTDSAMRDIGKRLTADGWYASADVKLEKILLTARGWNGNDQVTIFRGHHG